MVQRQQARMPSDPIVFVREAERITNERRFDALPALYAADVKFTAITDGAAWHARGAEETLLAWRVFFDVLTARQLSLTKRLVVAADGVLVNEWTGSLAGGSHVTGIEVWRFDEHGLVVEHTMHSTMDTRAVTSLKARLRLLLSQPRTALAFWRADRKHRNQVRTPG